MAVSRSVRAAGALGHLLLVVVLALGVFVMHTVGHPTEAHGSGTGQASHGAAALTQPAAGERPAAHGSEDPPHAAPAGHARRVDTAPAGHAGHPASTDRPVGAGDMATLCVAVLLAAWVLAALVRSALARDPDGPARLRAQRGAVARPDPPPRGPDLTRLSVLRL
ncbi:hypothetical protein [Streptomyces dubilierae]|uniref:Uncharacterized protein n=1 Tax=Streptomyces dubilierae TaxID=3075533 RepID=A0ABU2PD96_9ACTN|nr:hypothetical protein [Streptomyces sp. DSM 41921]MDT0389024.1 hypothetical protein [Streptomyces sp. DSM 41921]